MIGRAFATGGGAAVSPGGLTPLPFAEVIAWAKARGVVLPDRYYGELQGLARAMAFSIAGLAKLDQLQAVQDSLVANLESGESFGQWKKRVASGEIPLDLPAHRLENIFRTNIQGNYNRGRCGQQREAVVTHPWYLYDAVNDSRTRPSHAAMDGFVARHDDPVWGQWTPPCGYQCRCRRIALTEKQAERFRAADAKRMQDPELAAARAYAQPDKGWDYSVCEEPTEGVRRAIERQLGKCQSFQFASKKRSERPMQCGTHTAPGINLRSLEGFLSADMNMPPQRRMAGVERLSPTLDEKDLFARFMREFGAEPSAAVVDVAGVEIEIGRGLFTSLKGGWKIQQGERAQWLLYAAENIKRPDEIWREPGRNAAPDKRYYLSRFDVGRRGLLACIAVFERQQGRAGRWSGRTTYATTREDGYIETKRGGILEYWRWE